MTENPFFEAWNTPFELPPFDRIRPEHFPPASDRGMAEQIAAIDGIAGSSEAPAFTNTVEGLERSGRLLRRVSRVFNNLTSSATNPALDALDRDYAPKLAAHRSRIMLDPGLFARIDTLWQGRDQLGLAPEQLRLLDRHHLNFVRAGALLDPAEQARLLGYDSFAAYRLDDTMAKTPEAAAALLRAVWEPAKRKAAEERAELETMARADGLNEPIAPWDWRYYAEKVRQAKYALDEASVKPYFVLDNIVQAAFDTAGRLFGLRFIERRDCPVYHRDVRAYEVRDAADRPI